MKNFQKQILKINNKIKILQNKIKIITSNIKKKYPVKIVDNLNNRVNRLLDKNFNLGHKQFNEITKYNIQLKFKEMNKFIKNNKYDKKNSKLEDKIKNQLDEIMQNNKDILKDNTPKKKVKYSLNITIYRDAKEIDKNKRGYHSFTLSNTHDNEYIIYKKIFNIISDYLPKDLIIDHLYNNVDNGQQFIDNFFKFIKEHLDENDQFFEYLKTYLQGFVINNIETYEQLTATPFKIEDIKFKEDNNYIGIYNKFTKYSINTEAKNFNELIEQEKNNYLKLNFKKNCCFLTAIINKFYNKFEERHTDGKRKFKELTYNYLCTFMNLENKNDNIECSINEALPFFIKNKFSLFIYDIYLNLLYKYEPESKSHYALYLISRGNHLYEINNNIKTLSHTVKHNIEELEAIKSLKVSNTYNIFKNDENEYKNLFN